MGELGLAYREQGDIKIKTSIKVAYYNAVNYRARSSRAEEHLADEDLDWSPVVVRVGDICEVLEENGERAHVLVVGVMRHEDSVFLVVRWFMRTGRVHRQFRLEEYYLCDLFKYAAFFSLRTIDDQFFVQRGHFHLDKASGLYYRNDWVFNVV